MESIPAVPFTHLWCQCQGNASATPHAILVQRQMTRMHADAQEHALWYVCIVLFVYLLGLAVIIKRSGLHERHTALTAIVTCFSCLASVRSTSTPAGISSSKTAHSREHRPPKPKKHSHKNTTNESSERSLVQEDSAGTSNPTYELQLQRLEAPEEGPLGVIDEELSVTTTA